ncbi:hypothetical protein [Saccharibacillus kuerlensis]|uniref:Uncharacterized protein n=1 Tax=Saccharibacillus kuerlensis TaxID=459527 RepID=A0ABQ2KV23_9BACL|nr:hypothetical protein [Saccharibacillus kuerlensis]GGN94271.1 hypothetical protein GCM10010969_08850 [Saccharibacillus kuerlensis]
MTSYIEWFLPLCSGVNLFLMTCVLVLTGMTLWFRAAVNRSYDRGKSHE